MHIEKIKRTDAKENIGEIRGSQSSFLSTVEEIVDEARNGRMFILVDDEDRENEGDLVIPAQMATPAAINFMAAHGRGLICLAMTGERIASLGLEMMSYDNKAPHETAFTVSVEARNGVTTGISASDRARTIAVAIDAANGPDSIVTPGHIFPLVARSGGVLVRAGHTEAAVDVSRLAGLNPSGVICEIMRDDGTMARMDDLIAFAQCHGLKIGTIRDLIAYRLRHDHNVQKIAETSFESSIGGSWRAITYSNQGTGTETVALVKGDVEAGRPTIVRMHQHSLFVDSLAEKSPRSGLLHSAMRIIAEAGAGVIVLINRNMPDYVTRVVQARARGKTIGSPEMRALRDYGNGAQILAALGVHDMILLTNSSKLPVGLAGYGLQIVEEWHIR
jgi:3,4-dihydroxy 2-butanone 4-phosphate synthase/GTP cyclohydrolase II